MSDKSIAKITANFSNISKHHHLLSVYGTKGTFIKTLTKSYYIYSRDPSKKILILKKNKKEIKNSRKIILNQFINELYNKSILSMSHSQIHDAMKVAFLINKSLKTKKWENFKLA